MTQPRSLFPKTIKHYELRRLLGQGGMGLVVEGVDRRDGSEVAVKLLYPHLAASDPTYLDRFEREAHVAALLRSPYTVHLIDFGVENGQYFIVQEFIDGEPLSALVARGPVDPDRALRIAGEVARALEEANARNIVHRDIKPENILLDKEGRVKVTDFGIARSSTAPGITMTGGFVGTPAFAAPEQVDGEVDHRSDIYALGVTIYTMLTGRPPYQGKSAMDTLFQHRTAPLPTAPISHFPDSLQNLVRRSMEKDPLDRYQTAAELAGAIDRARQSLARVSQQGPPLAAPTLVDPSRPPTPSTEVTGPMRRSAVPPGPAPAAEPVPAPSVAPQSFAPAPTPPMARAEPSPPPAGPPPGPSPQRRRRIPKALLAAVGAGLVAAGVILAAVAFLGGDDEPGPAGPGTETPAPTNSPTDAASGTATQSPTPETPSATATPDRLPSVTPPVPASQLSSGSGAVVTEQGVAVNVWSQPSESASNNQVLATLTTGEGLIVVTNSPEASTVLVGEGLVFWRVLIPGTTTVGWAKEVIVDGSVRYLESARTHAVDAGETCFSISIANSVSIEDLMFVNQMDDAACDRLTAGTLLVIPN